MDRYEEIQNEISVFLGEGVKVLDEIVKIREKNKDISKRLISQPRMDAHLILHFTMLKIIRDHTGKMTYAPSEDTLYQMALITNLVQSIDPTYEMLLGGHYVAATALIRQSYEMNARLAEIQNNASWKSKRVPNVGQLPSDISRHYGELSSVAHFSQPELGHITEFELQPNVRAQSLSPIVKKDVLLRLLDFQLLTMWLSFKYQIDHFANSFGSDPEQYFRFGVAAGRNLQEAGLLVKDSPPST